MFLNYFFVSGGHQRWSFCKEAPDVYPTLPVGVRSRHEANQIVLICDSASLSAADSITVAFDRTFKYHYVLKLHFALPLTTYLIILKG